MTLFTNIKSFDKSFLLKLWLSLILYQLSVCPVSAQKDTMDIKDYILIINTYTESFPWSNRFISSSFSGVSFGGFFIRASNLRASSPKSIGVSFIGLAIIASFLYCYLQR